MKEIKEGRSELQPENKEMLGTPCAKQTVSKWSTAVYTESTSNSLRIRAS